MNLLKQLSSVQVSVLRLAVEKSSKEAEPLGLVTSQPLEKIPIAELLDLVGIEDVQRIDRELDHLRELGLIGVNRPFYGRTGGIDLSSAKADVTPTSLALHLYVRAQGSKLSAADYWNLTVAEDEETAPERTSEDSEELGN